MVRKKRTFLLLPLLALSNDFLLCKYNKEVRDCQRRKKLIYFLELHALYDFVLGKRLGVF